MNDKRVIFECEEEYIKFYKDTNDNNNPSLKEINAVKQAGYIRSNPVEEAEKMFQKVTTPFTLNLDKRDAVIEILQERLNCMNKQHEAIQYLKERQK